jgi:hypothetical protein
MVYYFTGIDSVVRHHICHLFDFEECLTTVSVKEINFVTSDKKNVRLVIQLKATKRGRVKRYQYVIFGVTEKLNLSNVMYCEKT